MNPIHQQYLVLILSLQILPSNQQKTLSHIANVRYLSVTWLKFHTTPSWQRIKPKAKKEKENLNLRSTDPSGRIVWIVTTMR